MDGLLENGVISLIQWKESIHRTFAEPGMRSRFSWASELTTDSTPVLLIWGQLHLQKWYNCARSTFSMGALLSCM